MPSPYEIPRIQTLTVDTVRWAARKGYCHVNLLLDCLFIFSAWWSWVLFYWLFFFFFFSGWGAVWEKVLISILLLLLLRGKVEGNRQQLPLSLLSVHSICLDQCTRKKGRQSGSAKLHCFKTDKECVSHSFGEKYIIKCLSNETNCICKHLLSSTVACVQTEPHSVFGKPGWEKLDAIC